MTKTNLLERRLKMLEQRKNRIKQMEASINIQFRKQRTRRLIELGGLVAKAKLDEWDSNALLGGLLSLKEKEKDPGQIKTWAHHGGVEFSEEKAEKLSSRKRKRVKAS